MSWKLSSRSQAFIVLVIISAIVMISEADKNKENKYSKKANQPEKNNGDELYSDFR